MYSLLDRYFGGILKRYVLLILIGAPISVIFCFVVLPQFSDKPDNTETEKVYKVPEQRGEASLTDAPSAQREVQGESPPPPKQNPDLEKHRRLQEISAQLEQESQTTQDPAKALWVLNLLEEMLKLQQALGLARTTDGFDPLLAIKVGKLVASNMTSDKRLPVSVGEELVDLLVESGDIDGAATTYMATQRAMENGDEFFMAEHWTDEQEYSDDPCCPDEPTQILETGHVHETPASQLPTPVAAKSIEAEMSEGLSPERFDQGRQLIDQYGTEEGLRRLREMDPDAARRFEREPRSVPSRDAPSGHTHSDGQYHDDSP